MSTDGRVPAAATNGRPGRPLPHESGALHATGEALYVDDLPLAPGTLVGRVVASPHAHARITSYDLGAARAMPGVHAVLAAADIPGHNDMGPVIKDEPCLAEGEVLCIGQAVFLIAAETEEQAHAAEQRITVTYEPLPAIVTLEDAIAAGSLFGAPRVIARGDADAALARAPHRLTGTFRSGAQEHWYLESQVALAVPGEDREMRVHASSQNPTETQALVAEVLGRRRADVVVEVRRMGGGFGGKETQANWVACWAGLLARATGRPVKVRLERTADQTMTGKRHRFLTRYEAGYADDGTLLALKLEMNSDAGMATDLSHAIMERARLHADNAYFVPDVRIEGRVWRTHLPSNTAFRGFGGPQGMAVMENLLDRIARERGLDPLEVRRRNYYGPAPRDTTPYGQRVERNLLARLDDELVRSSDYVARRASVRAFNDAHEFVKRGLAISPVKFGIAFTTTHLNQAGALVHVYADGTVMVNHGGTEMGQGLHTKIRQIAAAEFGVSLERVQVTPTDTSKVPNTSATAASSGADLNGMAVRDAIATLRARMAEGIAARFASQHGSPSDPADLVFAEDMIRDRRHPERGVAFAAAIPDLIVRQVNLSASGFYRVPDIGWDKAAGQGRPFHYFAFGMAVSEVEVDVLTGDTRLLRTDILHDAGAPVNTGVDMGQVEGGFVQGAGWVTTEDVKWDANGRLLSRSPSTYKIPTADDVPLDFRVALLADAPHPGTIHNSKAVGEPPLMLALSVWLAIKDAISAVAGHRREPELGIPAGNEAVLLAIERLKTAKDQPAGVP
jgi:xanthine dehydrogenase molybdopterin binding subunit